MTNYSSSTFGCSIEPQELNILFQKKIEIKNMTHEWSGHAVSSKFQNSAI